MSSCGESEGSNLAPLILLLGGLGALRPHVSGLPGAGSLVDLAGRREGWFLLVLMLVLVVLTMTVPGALR